MDICSRNKKLTIRRPAILVALALLLCSCKSTPPESMVTPPAGSKPPATTQQSSQPMRGIWLATVSRLDWPPVSSVNISNPTSRARVQQQAMIDKLDHLQRLGINTVFFQVKPDGTALWPSKIYWPFSRSAARYDVLAKWWADVVKPTRTRLYIGIAFYKVGEPSKIEPDWMINGGVPELKKQLDLNDAVPEISGTILFREDYLNKPQTQQAVSYLQSRWGS
ncbi:family 10 glycosylhydrolase [Escherichia coli]|uniref:family 10 glycosylhydrolase n=1 Tax=Escherichia coli TaxID=562 RepID=UPI000BDE5ADC|nr:family 10 glycosylhydrolase [Escherichia coli]